MFINEPFYRAGNSLVSPSGVVIEVTGAMSRSAENDIFINLPTGRTIIIDMYKDKQEWQHYHTLYGTVPRLSAVLLQAQQQQNASTLQQEEPDHDADQ